MTKKWIYVEDANGNLLAKEKTSEREAFALLKTVWRVIQTKQRGSHCVVYRVYR